MNQTRARNRPGEDCDRGDWIWAASLAGLTILVAASLSRLVFGGIPHVQDSIAQLFQARIFAGGHLWAPAPPQPDLFDYAHMILKEGRWYSQYPPGQALLLVPGVWLGAPWLVNPILGGLAVFGTYWLGREFGGRAVARIAALLGLISPFLLLMSAEFMSHAGALFACTYFLLFYFRAARGARVRTGIWAGLFAALAILIRPFSAFAMLIPCGLHAAWLLLKTRREFAPPLAAIASGVGAGLTLLLLYNLGTTGHFLRFGYMELHGSQHGLGFGHGLWGLEGHSFARGVQQSWDRLQLLHRRLFEWPITSLWPLALALGHRAWRQRWLLASFPVTLLVAHVFYWYHDANDCFGPRYLYEALAPLLILSAHGLLLVGWGITRRIPSARHRVLGSHFMWALVCTVLFTLWGSFTSWPRLFRPSDSPFEYYGRSYWAVDPTLGEAAARIKERALIFVDTRVPPNLPEEVRRTTRHLKFGSAFAHQRPDLGRAPIVYAHLTPEDWIPPPGDARAALRAGMQENAKHFPGRAMFYYRDGMEAPRRIEPR